MSTVFAMRRRNRRTRLWSLAVIGGLVGVGFVAVDQVVPLDVGVQSDTATAAPGDPGEPAPPTVVYQEGFENSPDTGNPLLLANYMSSIGGTYTASPYWSSSANCNGFIMSTTNTQAPGSCQSDTAGYLSLRKLAYALGTVNGSANPLTNSVDAAYTYGSTANNEVEFETVTPIPLPTPSRYLTFSVNAAATNCFSNHPRLQFALKSGSPTTEQPIGGVIDPCSDPRGGPLSTGGLTGGSTSPYRGGSFPATGSFITSSSSIGIVMRNLTGTGGGNDGAFDDIRILDVTPSLDKSFSTPNVSGVSTLTFTVTNTDELASKLGWSTTDTLQSGLVVASPSNASSTCTNGAVTATPGSGSIALAGDIAAGVAFCTFTVDVTTATTPTLDAPQNYQNCPADLSPLVGLDPPTTCATVTFTAPPVLEIEKTSTATVASKAGDVVNYAVMVRNVGGTGYTVAEPASLADDLSAVLDDATYNGDASASGGAPPPTVVGSDLSWSGPLAAGASVTISYSVTLTLAGDGVLENVATLPDGGGTATTLVEIPITPALSIVKSATPNDAANLIEGTVITYSFVVTNTGNVAIADPQVNETGFTGTGALSPLECGVAPASLMPGAQMICTATYTVQQADVDAGGFNNSATASGTDPDGGAVVSNEDDAPIPADAAPSISLDKSASPGPFTAAGQVVTYSFLVTNTGNVSVSGIAVTEDAFSGSGVLPDAVCDQTTLIPGATATCTAPYTLTQADVDQGSVDNTATASALSPAQLPVESAPDAVTITIAPSPSLTILKTAAPGGFTEADEVVTYSFLVTNTGNVTVTDVAVAEVEFTGTGPAPVVACPPAEVASLAPGDDVTCTATYTLTQADIDSGSVVNSASASATPPVGPPVTAPPSVVSLTFVASPSLTVEKTSDPATVTAAGQTVTYSFLITNTGNVTIDDVAVTEGSFTGTGSLSAAVCPPEAAELLPGASVTCTATYVVTQADIDAGGNLINTAAATGVPPSGSTISSIEDDATVAVDAVAGIALVKSVDQSEVTGAGATVTYTFHVTNTGGVTLSAVAITEVSFTGSGGSPAVTCPAGDLVPGESLDCTASYVTTDADVTAGRVDNTATAMAAAPDESVVESEESAAFFVVNPVPPIPLIPPLPPGMAATGTAATATIALAVLGLLAGAALLVTGRLRRPANH